MNIDKPIFIIGSGRSGTTILYELLSLHPEVCWFANYNERMPFFRGLPVFHRALDLPFIGDYLKRAIVRQKGVRFKIRPSEGDAIYHQYCGFEENKKTTEEDLVTEQETKLKGLMKRYLTITGKPRFLSKQISNNQRIRLIHAMFPDAYYIHIIRDGRAVASSMHHVDWWQDIVLWWYGHTPREWEREGREPLELCCLHWMRDVREILEQSHLFADRYLELDYEELTSDVHETIRRIVEFTGLSSSPRFMEFLPETLPNMDRKWEKQLTEEQKRVVNRATEDFMAELAVRRRERNNRGPLGVPLGGAS